MDCLLHLFFLHFFFKQLTSSSEISVFQFASNQPVSCASVQDSGGQQHNRRKPTAAHLSDNFRPQPIIETAQTRQQQSLCKGAVL